MDKLDVMVALDCLSRAMRDHHVVVPDNSYITLVGGSAMAVMDLREADDIDIFCSFELPDQVIRSAEEMVRDLLFLGDEFNIDVTTNSHIWGHFDLGDLGSEPFVGSYKAGVGEFVVRHLSPAALFICKAEAARDKDLEDCALIAQTCSPDSIVDRANLLAKYNDAGFVAPMVSNLISEIMVQFVSHDDPEALMRSVATRVRVPGVDLSFMGVDSMPEMDSDHDFGNSLAAGY